MGTLECSKYDSEGNLSYEVSDGVPDWGECEHDLYHYEGEWEYRLPNGHGKLETEDFHYEGDWLNGVFHGDGDLREFYEKDYEGREYFMEYSGQFKYGKKNGEGVWISHNSNVVGEFKND